MSVRSEVSCKSSASVKKIAQLELSLRMMALELKKSRDQQALMEKAYNDLVDNRNPISPDATEEYPNECDKVQAVNEYLKSLPSASTSNVCPDITIKMGCQKDQTGEAGTRTQAAGIVGNGANHYTNNVLPNHAQMLNTCLSLPPRRMTKFNGDPRQYHSFIRTFETTVTNYTDDPSILLAYLVEHCEGEAAEAINRCAILDSDTGYQEARAILQRRFGEPHIVARNCLDELTKGPQLRPNDVRALTKLADTMKLSSVIMKQLNYDSDLNACSTLSAIVQRLPRHEQLRWSELATRILKHRREPSFDELSEFINDRADAARTTTVYSPGLTADSSRKHSSLSGDKSRATVLATTTDQRQPRKPSCIKCSRDHYLDQCPQLIELDYNARKQYVGKKRLCFLCLKPNHTVPDCKLRRFCGKDGCRWKHHPLLHRDDPPPGPTNEENEVTVNHTISRRVQVSLGVIPVKVSGPNGDIPAWALLDPGSDTTLITNSLLEKTGLQPIPTKLKIRTMTGASEADSGVTNFELRGPHSTERVRVKCAWCINSLPDINPARLSARDLTRWPHLKDVEIPHADMVRIDLLLGSDVPTVHWVLEQKIGGPNDPFAARGPLGWALFGPLRSGRAHEGTLNFMTQEDDHNDIEECFRLMYNQEFNELSEIRREPSVDDRIALEMMENSTQYVGGHLQIALPWEEGCPRLPDNWRMAYRRLQCLKARLAKDKDLKAMYVSKIADYVEKGHAELVPACEQRITGPGVWYLPHHGVFKSGEEKKLRVVLDCAAKTDGTSLNSQLRKGPDLTNNLCGVLLRFRLYKHALVADIECMFHQVLVPPEDRDALRFLWWPEGRIEREPVAYRMKVHPFGATSSPSCAALALKNALRPFKDSPEFVLYDRVKKSFYVDDCLLSLDNTDDLTNCAIQLRRVLLDSGFRLTKFFSNAPETSNHLPVNERRTGTTTINGDPTMLQRTLGMLWDSENDHLIFRFQPWAKIPTRRTILSHTSSLFDPLGLVAPLLLPAKLILQDLCRRKAKWDEELHEAEAQAWQLWLNDMECLSHVKIPRWFGSVHSRDMELEVHGFSDASTIGYGAAIYLVIIEDGKRTQSNLVIGKSRVTPLKSVTVPRLELTAAVLVSRMLSFARQELLPSRLNTYLWTDSTAVLCMIRNTTTRYETFVANRLSTIHELTEPEDWRYVNTRLNPADLASRGLKKDDTTLLRWLYGPEFLLRPIRDWPIQPTTVNHTAEEVPDVAAVMNLTNAIPISTHVIESFSSMKTWTQLLRHVAWILRFVAWVSPNFRDRFKVEITKTRLTRSDLQLAEKWVCVATQAHSFRTELDLLNGRKTCRGPSTRNDELLNKLKPFLDGNLMRVGGRLLYAPMAYEAKHPILLPSLHFVTKLLVTHTHDVNGHMGTLHTLNAVRERFWIGRGQATVRSVLQKCFHCRRWQAGRERQLMAPLPEDRLRIEPPFTTVGVDYFGPFLVKRGRTREKRYGCVFTCLSTRAVHLEVGHSLETDSFLCVLSRFIARRGCPSRVYSDNGTNFCGAEAELRNCLKLWDHHRIEITMAVKGCEWHFIPPRASHRGGAWERIIGSVRRILRSLIGSQLLTDEALQTVIVEIEGILNNRPLTKLSDDPEDTAALTPNHILLMRKHTPIVEFASKSSPLTRRWRQAQMVVEAFWSRWLKEYIPLLQQRCKWLSERRDLRVGDLVLLANMSMPRGRWPKGILIENQLHCSGQL